MYRLRRSWEAGLCGVSLITERGTTQTKVKVPKCLLSVKQKGVFEQRQQGGRLRSEPSFKECVTAHLPSSEALKMDGAQVDHRYFRPPAKPVRGRWA